MLRRMTPGGQRLGIDIGPSAVKLVELMVDRGDHGVCRLGSASLPPGCVRDGGIHDEDSVAVALREAVEAAGAKSRHACVAVPSESTIIKSLSLPAELDDRELESRLQLDSDQHIPYPFSEVSFDFQSLGASEVDPEQQTVMLVACRRQIVEQRADLLRRVGLRPRVVDVETFAIERAMTQLLMRQSHPDDDDTPCVLVNLGAELSRCFVLQGGRTRYRHDIAMHDAGLGEAVTAIRNEPADSKALSSTACIMALAQQVHQALQLHGASGSASEACCLWLAGDAVDLPGVADGLAAELAMPVYVADPLQDMRYQRDPGGGSGSVQSSGMLTALGLALREGSR